MTESRDRRQWIENALSRYERPLVRYAWRLLGDVDTARDVVQECFLRLVRQRSEKVDGHVREWLYAVCRNCCVDQMRKRGRMDMHENLDLLAADDTLDVVARGDEMDRIRHTVGGLPARQQEILRLKFQEGLSYKQIASVTQVSVSNVGFLLHQALKTLRARLGAAAGGRNQA